MWPAAYSRSGPHVEQDDVATREAARELGRGDVLHRVTLAEVLVGEHAHLGQMADGDVADRRPQLGDLVAGEAVDRARALAAGADEAGPRRT